MKAIQFGDLQFAIREHHATTEHWDFRFEFESRLLSFVSDIPPHLNPDQPIKLIRVKDHQLKYLLSERIIPAGMPGAGPTAVGDKGVYSFLGPMHRSVQVTYGRVRIHLKGGLLRGDFFLKRLGSYSKVWIWKKEWDDQVDLTFKFPHILTPEKIQKLGGKRRNVNDFLPLFKGYPLNPFPGG